MYFTVAPKTSVGVMEMYVISKVISLKLKTLIFAVICTYLNLDCHKEERACIQADAVQFRRSYSNCPADENNPTVIFMGILYSVLHIVIWRAFVYS